MLTPAALGEVHVWNRPDAYRFRINPFLVILRNESGVEVWRSPSLSMHNRKVVPVTYGGDVRYVKIQLDNHTNFLHVTEIEATPRQAQSSLDSAESAWRTKRAACAKLAIQREKSMCAFGTQAQAKCSAEAEFTKLVAATQQIKGDADSEVDRESEWMALRSTKCMMTKAMQKGLDGAVAGAHLDACAAEVDFNKDVGKLNTRQAELAKLSRTNACAKGVISFFNGQTWNIPAGSKPSSKSYNRSKFTPQLDPTSGNFDFCSAA